MTRGRAQRRMRKMSRLVIALALCLAAILGVGCNRASQTQSGTDATTIPVPVPAPTSASSSPPAAATPSVGTTPSPGSTPSAGSNFSSIPGHIDIGTGASLTPTPDLDSKIAQLQKSGGSKKTLSVLYTKRGMERMMDGQASPHIKYPAALQDFRKAVKLDPANTEAVNSKNLIESIYRSMGRSIPGG